MSLGYLFFMAEVRGTVCTRARCLNVGRAHAGCGSAQGVVAGLKLRNVMPKMVSCLLAGNSRPRLFLRVSSANFLEPGCPVASHSSGFLRARGAAALRLWLSVVVVITSNSGGAATAAVGTPATHAPTRAPPQAREAAATRHMLLNVAGVMCVSGGLFAIYSNKARGGSVARGGRQEE